MIRLTIQRKVFLAIFLLASTLIVLLALVMRWNLGQGFERYVSAAEFARLDWLVRKAETEYAAHGSWDFLRDPSGQEWRRFLRPQQGNAQPPPPNSIPTNDILRIGPRIGLLDVEGRHVAGGGLHDANRHAGTPITQRPVLYQGGVVGYFTLAAAPSGIGALDAAFLASQNRNLLLAALSALALSLLAAGTLSRHLLWPIRALGAGASQIAQGQLDTRIAVRGHDELGDLATTFNTMAQRLSDMEASRRDWIADTSHELRTPLAVLRAEIEALQDGVHSPDAPTLARLHRQTIQLTQLVDDLRLTLDREPGAGVSDFKLIDPMQVLADSVDGFHERFAAAGIVLDTSGVISVMSEIMMLGDAGRLQQVFDNLLENSLRYTNAGGRLAITIHAKASGLTLHFDDTAPAPPVAALPHLFDRFFRADASRNRALGGSGLGLSICKTLVQEQGGTIQASLSQLGGLSVTIFLPLQTL